MASLLERKLIVVTGKGGTGKSTVACALGLAAAQRRLHTLVVEIGEQHHISDLFAIEQSRAEHADRPGLCEHADPLAHARHSRNDRHTETIKLQENLWGTSLDPDLALIEWLQTLTGRISARLLASSSTFQYFAAAAPGAKELVSMIRVRELCEGRSQGNGASNDKPPEDRRRPRSYDLVVLDAPATGHALAMLRSPQTFAAIVRVGPLAEQAGRVRELLEDPQRTGYVAVTHATDMAVTETLELEQGLRRGLKRNLDAVVVNGTMPRRFTREELEQVAELDTKQSAGLDAGSDVVHNAAQMARSVHERARVQQSQIARLRRQRFAVGTAPDVLTIPLAFTPELDLDGVRDISTRLERKL
jgi:anion-transporting  ArsA/GET3 family ATPase